MGKWAKYKKKYCKSWESEEPFKGWLKSFASQPQFALHMKDIDVDQEAYCILCKVPLRAHKSDLKRHALSQKHRENGRRETLPKLTAGITVNVASVEQKKFELKLAAYIAFHSAVRSVDHLGELFNESFQGNSRNGTTESTDYISLHRTKCTCLLTNVINPSLLDELIADIGDSAYSLIIDESTDVSVVKYLALVVRYHSVKKGRIVTTYLGMAEVTLATAEALFNTVVKFLADCKLPLKNCIGIGTDGGNNLCGCNHSLYTLLKEEVPKLQLVKCVCHSLHLCSSKACNELPSNVEFLLRETYNWFHCSSLRKAAYRETFDLINTGEDEVKFHEIVGVSQTRWLSRGKCVTNILNQWLELKTHFLLVSQKERCYMARMLHEMFQDETNKLYFIFLSSVLGDFNRMNLLFQQQNADPVKVLGELKQFYLTLLRRVVKPELVVPSVDLSNNDNFLPLSKVDFGVNFVEFCSNSSLNQTQLTGTKLRCQKFLTKCCEEVKKRFPENFQCYENLRYLAPSSCLSHFRPDFSTFVKSIKLVSQENVNLNKVESQWRNLLSIPWREIFQVDGGELPSDSEVFWCSVFSYTNASGEAVFRELALCVLRLLCLPISNACVERVFSVMNCTKTKLRNRMGFKLLDSILRIRSSYKCCKSFAPTAEMLTRFKADMYSVANPTEMDCANAIEDIVNMFE